MLSLTCYEITPYPPECHATDASADVPHLQCLVIRATDHLFVVNLKPTGHMTLSQLPRQQLRLQSIVVSSHQAM